MDSGLYGGSIGDILGLYWDHGKSNGNYYLGCTGFSLNPINPK